jgi:ribosomal-protein-alanine N-acetyltransferase
MGRSSAAGIMGGNAPECIQTARLVLRRPQRRDAEIIFSRYANDADVTRYLAWPRHRNLRDTLQFLEFSDNEWDHSPAGPYLIESRSSGRLIGSTGIEFETEYRASTGYVLARDAWGQGYASEALLGIVGVCGTLGLTRLHAIVHVEHAASRRVLEKCGFAQEGTLLRHTLFPNIDARRPLDVVSYARVFDHSSNLSLAERESSI